ncbi:MAG TPA: VOC family protein [Trueperaceae bacterium]|nr:VOC family protein [Trueperaceae bacterium]
MPEKIVDRIGQAVWADVTAPDVPATAGFYQHVFGWEYNVAPSELGYYHTALEAGKRAAGIGSLSSPDAAPSWTVSFAVADVRKAVARANDLGAIIVLEPTEIPQQALIALAEAPGGARFGLWQAYHNHGFEARAEHGGFAWCEASVADVEAAVAFYCGLFGYEAAPVTSGGQRILNLGGKPACGISPRQDYQARDEWTPYFQVHDTDAAVAAVQAGGGAVLFGPAATREGRVAVFSDENGAHFGVLNP